MFLLNNLVNITNRPCQFNKKIVITMLSTYILSSLWCLQSIVLTVKGCSAVIRRYLNVFRVFLVKQQVIATS